LTAFAFGFNLERLKTDQHKPCKTVIIKVLFIHFTSKNETSKNSLMLSPNTPLIRRKWQLLTQSGISLFRLMVSVLIRVKTLGKING
jgi:hypothetical protein